MKAKREPQGCQSILSVSPSSACGSWPSPFCPAPSRGPLDPTCLGPRTQPFCPLQQKWRKVAGSREQRHFYKHLGSYHWKTEVSKQVPKVWKGVPPHLQDDEEANKLDPQSASQINAGQAEPEPPGGREGPENQQDAEFSLVAGTKLNSKRSSGEGQRSPDSQMLPCGLSHEGSQPQGPHMVPRQTWSVKPETERAPCGSTMWEHNSSGEEGHGNPGEVSKGCQVCKSLFFSGDQSSGRKRKIQRSPLDSGRPSPVKASNYWVLLCVRHCSEHFTCVCVCVWSVAQSCPTLCNPNRL